MDGLLGVKAEATLKCISSRLVKKWKENYSRTCGYVKSIIEITIILATHRCIWGDRVSASQIRMKLPQWEDGAGLYLFR